MSRILIRAKNTAKTAKTAKFARNFPLTAENPHSLQQGTNRHNFTQLQAKQNKATCNKVFQSLPIHPKLFHVEQFARRILALPAARRQFPNLRELFRRERTHSYPQNTPGRSVPQPD